MELIALYARLVRDPNAFAFELLECEFVPVVTVKAFFGDKRSLKTKLKATLIISA
jgi:hypothetical protein